MRLLIVLSILAITVIIESVESKIEIKYKVCTAEELRKQLEQTCMRISDRDTNSNLEIGPYGSLSFPPIQVANARWIEATDAELLDILQQSKPVSRGRRQNPRRSSDKKLLKRSMSPEGAELCEYLTACCDRSCAIDVDDLVPFCRFNLRPS